MTKNITRTPGAHERDAQWSPDGKCIAYISDATGETELYLQDAVEGNPVQLTKNNDTYTALSNGVRTVRRLFIPTVKIVSICWM